MSDNLLKTRKSWVYACAQGFRLYKPPGVTSRVNCPHETMYAQRQNWLHLTILSSRSIPANARGSVDRYSYLGFMCNKATDGLQSTWVLCVVKNNEKRRQQDHDGQSSKGGLLGRSNRAMFLWWRRCILVDTRVGHQPTIAPNFGGDNSLIRFSNVGRAYASPSSTFFRTR